jgi:orotate phosphoribosyltransferase
LSGQPPYDDNRATRERLKAIFASKAFLRRQPPEKPFRLASGGESWVFFDCKPVTQDPEGISLVAELIYSRVSRYGIDAIGGPETGAIPITTAVAQLSYSKKNPIRSFWVRRQRKDHGTEKWIEGDLQPRSKVVIVEDVATRGNSVYEAIERVVEPGMDCTVAEVITLVDREQGARAKLEQAGYSFSSIFKMLDFAA